jgi:predicted metal-dependent hydrolase
MMFRTLSSDPSPPAVEQRTLQLSDKHIPYTLKRSAKRRSIGLRIDERGLTVSMPLRASERWLHSVLQDKADWVARQLDKWQARKALPVFWAEGSSIPFRGEQFLLSLTPRIRGAKAMLQGEVLHVPVGMDAEADQIEKAVVQWYREEALRVFRECSEYFAPLMNVAPREIRLTSARTQWGSCTIRGVVRLNWHLVKMPLHLIDYVVVHELAHLVEMNHSPAFWKVVEGACPDYRQCRAELHGYGIAE